MSENIEKSPQVPEKHIPTSTSNSNLSTMNNLGYNPYMYNSMTPYGGGGFSMGGGMFGSALSSNNPNLPAGLQQSLSLLETVLITISSTTQLIESSYIAAKGIMQTFKEIGVQFQSLRQDFRNGVLSAIYFLKKILLMKRDRKRLSDEERRSLKRLLIFVSLAAGVPLILKKLVNSAEQPVSFSDVGKMENIANGIDSNGNELLDPSNAQFIKVLYDYTPASKTTGELPIKKNEILAILSKKDAIGNDSQWWKVRNKQGKTGYIPSNYIEILERKKY